MINLLYNTHSYDFELNLTNNSVERYLSENNRADRYLRCDISCKERFFLFKKIEVDDPLKRIKPEKTCSNQVAPGKIIHQYQCVENSMLVLEESLR